MDCILGEGGGGSTRTKVRLNATIEQASKERRTGGRGDWPSSHSLLNTRGGATCFLGSSLTETQEAIHNNRAVICVIYILCIDLSNATRRDVMLDKLTYAILPYLTQNLKQPIILWRAYNCVDDNNVQANLPARCDQSGRTYARVLHVH